MDFFNTSLRLRRLPRESRRALLLGAMRGALSLSRPLARGRGVILASPHQFCHELGAAYLSGRHKVVALVRESKNRWRRSMKERWYQATGMDILPRPRQSSLMADTFAYLRILKSGR